MRTAIVALLIVLIALLVLNPGMDEFAVFAEAQSERIIQREVGDNVLGRALGSLGGSLAGSYIDRVTERENYFLFSTYTLDFDGEPHSGDEWRFLGVGGQFIEMERPEGVRGQG